MRGHNIARDLIVNILKHLKYIVLLKSSVIIDAETPEDAIEQVDPTIEDVRKRNCGDISDEIIANTKIVKVVIGKSNDE